MTAITHQQIKVLVHLQTIENEKFEVKKLLDGVASKVKALDDELAAFRATVEAERQAQEAIQKQYAEYEEQVQFNQALIAKIEEKRRSVKTEREYQALVKEENQLRTRKSQIEEEMIDYLGRIENLNQLIADKEKDLQQIREQVQNDKQAIQTQAAESETAYAELTRKCDQVAAEVAPELFKKFIWVKSRTPDGRGLAPVKDAVCMACHMNIPPQMFNELQRGDSLKMCPFCFRIIYWDNGSI